MNRLDRITATLIHLQSKRLVIAKEMADRFEVSLRTVYRDIKTLQEAGVPIGSENGVGYYLVDGYTLPPLMITEEEANALMISEKLLANFADKSLKKDLESLLIKVKAILRSSEKDKVEKLENRIAFSSKPEMVENSWLSVVQKSITHGTVLHISYSSIGKNEHTERQVEPLAIYFTGKSWVLIAFCRLRKALREFRLDHITKAVSLTEKYHHKTPFSINDYFQAQIEKYSKPS
ncbi:HTH domain-containing protein [Fulvivirga kasyanovii]|uniref:YafY family transcriptional regulator n=1 Tax=Fulvivirga kasyanovii TaxID=396812 RepID=A0ABW9RM74_9BACT|nr:YafY family protein [Fulvivirga kasyanovii]MTI25223.1 YafY family transcriptional regulator [Fulvivirga kasyanovii]